MGALMALLASPELWVATVRMCTPLLLVALGELYSERAGLVNIGLDGIMILGALFGFLGMFWTKSTVLALLLAAAAGIALNMVFGLATVKIRADQIVNGMALNILAPAVATFIYRALFGLSAALVTVPVLSAVRIPGLSNIPWIGPVLFNHNAIVYLAFVMVAVTSVFLYRTKPGLNFKSVGEFPQASESLGINVERQKLLACALCGALAGVGGAFLTVGYIGTFSDGMTAGRGFIALAAVIFGRWKPLGVMLASLLFGFADAVQLRLQLLRPDLPFQILAMLPYAITLVALVAFGAKNLGPRSNGKPYFREAK